MVNDLHHQYPGFHEVAISRLKLRRQGLLLTSRQRQQSGTALVGGLLQFGECQGRGSERASRGRVRVRR